MGTTPSLLQKHTCGQVQPVKVINRLRDGFVITGLIPETFVGTSHLHLAVAAKLIEHGLVLLVATLGKEGLSEEKAIAEESRT